MNMYISIKLWRYFINFVGKVVNLFGYAIWTAAVKAFFLSQKNYNVSAYLNSLRHCVIYPFMTVIFHSINGTRAPRGTDRSPEYNEHFCYKLDSTVKNLTTEWNQKQQHFITHASRSLLWIWFVAVAFRSEEEVFLKKGNPPPPPWPICLVLDLPLGKYGQNIFMQVRGPVTYFGPALDPPLDGSGQKTTTLVRDHEHFMPTKFRKYPLSGSVV